MTRSSHIVGVTMAWVFATLACNFALELYSWIEGPQRWLLVPQKIVLIVGMLGGVVGGIAFVRAELRRE